MTSLPGPDASSGVDPNVTRPTTGLRRHTTIMAAGTATSRLLGFVRNALLVAAIGVNAGAANAFDVANRIPNVLFALLASGVLNAVLVPQIVRAFARPGGKRTVDRILTLGGAFMLGVTVIFTLGATVLVRLFTEDWGPELTALAVAFALWCIPQLFFYGLYTLLGQVLNAREQFGPFMWAPVANNIVSITGLIVFIAIFGPYAVGSTPDQAAALAADWGPGKIALLAGVATLGIAAQALILLWPLLRGGYRWRWTWRGPAGELAVIRRVAGWALAAVAVEQIGVAWASRIAAAAGEAGAGAPDIAGNAAYTHALVLYLVPHSLITVSIVTALIPGLSRFAAAQDMAGVRRQVSRGLRTIGVFTVFASATLIVLAPYAVRVVLPTAIPEEVQSVAYVLVALSAGLVPLGAMVLLKSTYFALQDARSVFTIHLFMTAVLVGVALSGQALLHHRWWVVGVATGLALSNTVAMTLRMGGLRRKLGGLDGRRVARTYARCILAILPGVGVGLAIQGVFPDVDNLLGWSGVGLAAGTVAATGLAMLIAYGAALWLLGVDEWRDAASPLLRRLGIRVR